MKTKRKTVLRQIKKWSEMLPEDTYLAYPKYYQPKWEEDEEGKKVLRFGTLEKYPINHARRMKKMYDLYSYAGVSAYMQMYGYQLSNQQNQ
jgi:hypothetical protein